jgi:hypothetical protein
MDRDQDQTTTTTVRDDDEQLDTHPRGTSADFEARVCDGEALQRYEH